MVKKHHLRQVSEFEAGLVYRGSFRHPQLHRETCLERKREKKGCLNPSFYGDDLVKITYTFTDCVCVCICMCVRALACHGICVESEDNMQKVVLSFYLVDPWVWTQVERLSCKNF